MATLDSEVLPAVAGPSSPAGTLADLGFTAAEMQTMGEVEAKIKKFLADAPKVSITIPRSCTGGSPMYAGYSGVSMRLPVGVPVDVPEPIAQLLAPRIAAELAARDA